MHHPLRTASLVLFLGYVLLLVIAGAWGVVGARLDFPILLRAELADLPDRAAANTLSQYRFLRAMELGFGLFALHYRHQVHTLADHNRLFLSVMALGVVARLVSVVADGVPSAPMWIFLAWELVGVVVIFAYTRRTLRGEEPWTSRTRIAPGAP